MSDAHAHHDEHHVHVVPMKILIGIFVALLFLTFLTVWLSDAARSGLLDFGSFNIVITLVIALVKGSLVALYFMHLRYDSMFNGLVLVSSLLFVVLFIIFAILDTNEYLPNQLQYEESQQVTSP